MGEMTVFGALRAATRKKSAGTLSPVSDRGWFSLFDSDGSRPGSWQQNIAVNTDTVLANWALFACVTLIASDIGKLRLQLVELVDGIWSETDSPAYSPVLRKPNRYQTRQKFVEQWIISKLTNGNAYILKERDNRDVVVGLYVLDPQLVTPLVAPDGSVYYQLREDVLSQVPSDLPAVPASEIIHDTMVCLHHPLVGISPITACGLAAMQGLKIQANSERFFTNMSRPSGLLIAPAAISAETQAALKTKWEDNYSGDKVGRVAVLGDGLKFESLAMNAVDAQMVEQLKMSAEMICSTFHMPSFKIGAGVIPAGQKVEDLNQIYYSDCLQALLESAEALLDEGLNLTAPRAGRQLGTMFNLDDLLKMDTATQIATLKTATDGSIMASNEARKRLNLPPLPGGDSPLSQQQNYSLEALSKRDAQDDPFSNAGTTKGGDVAPALRDAIEAAVAKAVSELGPPLDGLDGEPGRDAVQIDVLPEIDPERVYARGTYASHRGGRLRSVRKTNPLSEKGDIYAAGWVVDVEGVHEFDVRQLSEREFVFEQRMTGGNVRAQRVKMPVVLDRGVYVKGKAYEAGDGVTYGGSFWIARGDTTGQPETDGGDWRLAVKRGARA